MKHLSGENAVTRVPCSVQFFKHSWNNSVKERGDTHAEKGVQAAASWTLRSLGDSSSTWLVGSTFAGWCGAVEILPDEQAVDMMVVRQRES